VKLSFADILAREGRERDKKVAAKLPQWSSCEGLTFPTSLCLEQSSSQRTAFYKAELASGLSPGKELIWDLTGGLGVDTWAFSQKFAKVIYNEHNSVLADAVKNNFRILGVDNVQVFCSEAEELCFPGTPDIIYLDPARRDDSGKKVFLVEDCRPDVLSMLPKLFELSSTILVKLSPMADVSMLSKRFGGHLKEIHIVGLEGECKELLCVLSRSVSIHYKVVAVELEDGSQFKFDSDDSASVVISEPRVGDWLWEPGAPLMKAGCFQLITEKYGVKALGVSTHLFIAERPSENALFKSFEIVAILDFGKAGFKEVSQQYPQAEVSARNVPMKSEELKKRLGVRSGGDYHIFACSTPAGRKLLVTKCSHHSER